MIRWNYLLPRMGILLFLLLLVHLLTTPIAKFAIVNSLQSMTGAKVEMSGMEVSIWKGIARVNDLQIADPNETMSNLLQADSADFELNPTELMHRRWVVERARLKRVQFGTPRTESGALTGEDAKRDTGPNQFLVDFVKQKVKSLGHDWSEQMQVNLPGLVESQLETVRLANQLRQQWPAAFQKHRNNAISLKERGEAIKAEFTRKSDNPLRDLERYRQAIVDSRQLMADFHTAQQQVHDLANQFRADQQALKTARQNDLDKFATAADAIKIQPDQLTQLLLSERQAELIRESVSWLKWFRNSVPDPKEDFRPKRARGFDVQFRQQPTLLLKLLELQGEGKVAGQLVHFSGQVENISTTPKLISEPVTFDLRGGADTNVLITGTVDRRGPRNIETIEINCPDIETPAQVLGDEDSLVIGMAAGRAALQLNARIMGDQLVGQIHFRQSDVALKAESIDGVGGAANLVGSLNQQLGMIDSFSLGIDLGGTLDQPTAEFQSDLGQQVAGMVANTFQESVQQKIADKTRLLESKLDGHISGVDELLDQTTNEVLAMLTQNVTVVAELQGLLDTDKLQFPRFR